MFQKPNIPQMAKIVNKWFFIGAHLMRISVKAPLQNTLLTWRHN